MKLLKSRCIRNVSVTAIRYATLRNFPLQFLESASAFLGNLHLQKIGCIFRCTIASEYTVT